MTYLQNMAISNLYPPRAQIKRQKMIYHCKFGEFGVMEGQVMFSAVFFVYRIYDLIKKGTH